MATRRPGRNVGAKDCPLPQRVRASPGHVPFMPDAGEPNYGRSYSRRLTRADLGGEHRLDILRRVRDASLAAMTDQEIADELGVDRRTMQAWAADDAAFAAALRGPLDLMTTRVRAALYHRAVGYTYQGAEAKVLADGRLVRYEKRYHVPPDVQAAIFWMSNADPANWRQRIGVEVDDKRLANANEDDARKIAMAMMDIIHEAKMRGQEPPQDEPPRVIGPPPGAPKVFETAMATERSAQARAETGTADLGAHQVQDQEPHNDRIAAQRAARSRRQARLSGGRQ